MDNLMDNKDSGLTTNRTARNTTGTQSGQQDIQQPSGIKIKLQAGQDRIRISSLTGHNGTGPGYINPLFWGGGTYRHTRVVQKAIGSNDSW